MTTNTHRRFTTGITTDNLPAIIASIERDALTAYERAELLVGPLDARPALGFVLTQALDELASYWPAQEFADELNSALLNLRCQVLPSLRGDARPAEVLKHAAQTIVQLRQDIEYQAALLLDQNDTLVDQEEELKRLRGEHTAAQTRYDWSPVAGLPAGITAGVPTTPTLTYQGEDGDGNPVLALDDEPVGVAVAAPGPEEGAIDWMELVGPDLPPQELRLLIASLEDGPPEGTSFHKLPAVTRRRLALEALDQLARRHDNNLLMREFNAERPEWMPTASALVSFFDTNWPDLLLNVRRTRR